MDWTPNTNTIILLIAAVALLLVLRSCRNVEIKQKDDDHRTTISVKIDKRTELGDPTLNY